MQPAPCFHDHIPKFGTTKTDDAMSNPIPLDIADNMFIDHSSYPSCRTGCPPLAECRPKFISVTAWRVRFRECSTSSTRFNLCENCYISGLLRCRIAAMPRWGESVGAPGQDHIRVARKRQTVRWWTHV